MTSFHNDVLLRFLQQGLFAHPWLASGALWLIFFGLPHHRRFVFWAVQAPAIVVCVAAFFPYDVANVSVLLATTMGVVSLWHVVRAVLWSAVDSRGQAGHALLPSRWLNRAASAYLKLDPRAAYWLDFRRLQFGLPVTRTSGQRRAGIRPQEATAVGRAFWLTWFRIVELRLAVRQSLLRIWRRLANGSHMASASERSPSSFRERLVRYWRPDAGGLELQDGLLKPAVVAAADAARESMLVDWTGGTLENYMRRTESVHRRSLQSAAAEGRRWMSLREARAEILAFHEPWPAWRSAPAGALNENERALLQAAQFEYVTWQYRRRFDHLWWSPETSNAGDADGEALDLSQETKEGPPDDSSEEPTQAVGSATGLADSDVDLDPFGSDPDEFDDSVADLTDTRAAIPQSVARNGESDGQDVELQPLDPDAGHDERTRERLSDVRRASRLLETALQLPPADDRHPDADLELRNARLESAYVRLPNRRPAILLLAALFCIRSHHAGGRRAATHKPLLAAWIKRVKATRTPSDPRKKEGKDDGGAEAFLMTQVPDVLLEQHAFLDLAKWFRKHISLPAWAVLQLAEAHLELSRLLRRNPELRKLHRADAIRLFFEARFPGLWTWEIGGSLVDGAESRADYLRLLAEGKVAAGGAGSLAIAGEEAESDFESVPSDGRWASATDAVLLVEVRYRTGPKDASKWYSTPFRIGSVADCPDPGDFRIRAAPESVPLVEFSVRQGRLWSTAIKRSKLFSVNGRKAEASSPLAPGSRLGIGEFTIHIGSVGPATG